MRFSSPENYPRPQFFRPDWMSLDGEWQFELDLSNSGAQRGLQEGRADQFVEKLCFSTRKG